MRAVFALLALGGCRGLLGIEEASLPPPDDGAPADVSYEDAIVDAKPDAPPLSGCPASYMALPNSGPRGHRYLLINTQAPWPVQRDACTAMQGFLAFPDGANLMDAQAELMAIIAFAGPSPWLGIDDVQLEGTYRTSLGMVASQVTQMLIQLSGNSLAQDCFVGANDKLNDEDCMNNRRAVCECVP